jgi:hypothetical protein
LRRTILLPQTLYSLLILTASHLQKRFASEWKKKERSSIYDLRFTNFPAPTCFAVHDCITPALLVNFDDAQSVTSLDGRPPATQITIAVPDHVIFNHVWRVLIQPHAMRAAKAPDTTERHGKELRAQHRVRSFRQESHRTGDEQRRRLVSWQRVLSITGNGHMRSSRLPTR